MDAGDHDLLNPANARSRLGNIRKAGANTSLEDPLFVPEDFNFDFAYRKRRNGDRHRTSEFEESDGGSITPSRASLSSRQVFMTSPEANSKDHVGASDPITIARGQRLVIAIDYGTTFTGNYTQ